MLKVPDIKNLIFGFHIFRKMFFLNLPLNKIIKVSLGKYIHELLLDNETVIIPGFGAFVSNYKPAEIKEESNEIIPPSKEITFNQKIRNNDGLLVGYIADIEGISHFDALKLIEKERENIIYRLDKGEKITLEKTGILLPNENQEIQFEPFVEDHLLLDSYGLETISLENDLPDAEIKTAKPITANSEEKVDKSLKNEPEEIVPKISDELNEPELNTEKIAEFISANNSHSEESKKKRSWLWYLLVLIPIIIAGYFVAKDELTNNVPVSSVPDNDTIKISSTLKDEIVPIDTFQNDSVEAVKSDSVQIIESKIDSIISQKFYLIGGGFKVEENANKFLEQFDVEGFEAFHLGKIRNFYFVAIGVYNSEREALNAKSNFQGKKPDSDVWVYIE